MPPSELFSSEVRYGTQKGGSLRFSHAAFLCLLVASWQPLAAASRMTEVGRLPFPCWEGLKTQTGDFGQERRRLAFLPLGGDGQLAVVAVQLLSRTGTGRDVSVTPLKSCYFVVDTGSFQVVEQWESEMKRYVAAVSTGEGLMVLGRLGNELVLEGSKKRFQWPCPSSLCGERLFFGNVAVLAGSGFPLAPLELAGPSGDEKHMVTIYRLYPPEEEGKVGTVEEVRSLVPAEEFGQAWLQATDYEGQLKAMWDQVTMATRLKFLTLGLDVEKELQKTLNYNKKDLPSRLARFYLDRNRLLLHTQHPWSMALVDLKEGSFRFLVPKNLGELKPLFTHSWIVPYFAAGAGRDALWLLLKGQLAETRESYKKTHPDRPCDLAYKAEEFDMELCHYFADVLMRLELKEKDEVAMEFWVLGDEERLVERNVLSIGKKSLDFLEAHPGELVVKRLRF